MEPIDRREVAIWVAEGHAAHRALLTHLAESLTDDTVASPSLLEGWSIGHVLAHLARNADSHTGMLDAAARGDLAVQYPGGAEQRSFEIERDANRPAAAHLADLAATNERLEAAWAATPPEVWDLTGTVLIGSVALGDLPYRRCREVVVHHADLGLPSYGPAEWPARFVREELRRREMVERSRIPMGLAGSMSQPALALSPNERVHWLLGRSTPPGLDPVRFA